MEFCYSTELIEPRLRHDYWNNVINEHLIAADGDSIEENGFHGKLHGQALGNVIVGECSARKHSFHRTQQRIRKDSVDDLIVMFVNSGRSESTQCGKHLVLNPGDITLNDAARPFTHNLDNQSLLLLRVPRVMIISRFPQAEAMLNVKIAEKQPLSTALGGMMHAALTFSSNASAAVRARFAGTLLDTLTAAMEAQSEECATSGCYRHDQLYDKAITLIEAYLDDCNLDFELIADKLNVSRRTLARVFAVRQTTVMQQLWKRRLERSHAFLREGRVQQVTQAALQCGFSDLSHFSRLFKKTYGQTPRSMLPRQNQA